MGKVVDRLTAAMVEAFVEVSPEAPTENLVEAVVVECWADAKD